MGLDELSSALCIVNRKQIFDFWLMCLQPTADKGLKAFVWEEQRSTTAFLHAYWLSTDIIRDRCQNTPNRVKYGSTSTRSLLFIKQAN